MIKTYTKYHSREWEILLLQKERAWNGAIYGWVTWSVDGEIATMVWTQF